MGEPRAALEELELVRQQRSNGDPNVVLPASLRVNLAEALRHLGRPAEARVIVAGAADELFAGDEPRLATNALMHEGASLIALGDREPAA